MLTLIKREVVDNMGALVLAVFVPAIITVIIVKEVLTGLSWPPIGIPVIMITALWPYLLCGALVATGFGAAQIHDDNQQKISTFLSTLATTRTRILAARVLVGLFLILIMITPFVLAYVILLRVFPRLAPLDTDFLVRSFATIIAVFVCSYVIGLQCGWRSSKLMAILFSIVLSAVLVLVVAIKGFGAESIIILALFTIASLIWTWQKFLKMPL